MCDACRKNTCWQRLHNTKVVLKTRTSILSVFVTFAVQANITLLISYRENDNNSILLREIFILKQDFLRPYSQHGKASKSILIVAFY